MNLPGNKFSLLLCLLLCSHASLSYAERSDRDKPMQMEADRVIVDDPNQTSTFEGNVRMTQGTLLIEGIKIVVSQDKKGYSQVNANGQPAHFRQKRDGVNEYAEGFGERIEYDSQAEIANIFGQARVKRNGDDVRGEHIIYNTKTGIFQVFGTTEKNQDTPNQGRVTIVIQPKNDPANSAAPNAPAPGKPSNPAQQHP
jgi:lipopolysaccharide export system protein LptA